MTMIPDNILEVYDADHLQTVIDANELGPEGVTEAMCERIIDVAHQRTQSRMEGPLDDTKDPQLVFTNWDQFCRETFGSDSGSPNRFALTEINWDVSDDRQAWLCEEAVAIQQGWLESGDSRRTQLEEIDVSDDEYVDDPGTFWCPKEYTTALTFADELLRDMPAAADAM